MPSTAEQSVSGFVDPYNYTSQYQEYLKDMPEGLRPGGFLSKIGQFFGLGTEDRANEMKLADDRAYERASIDSARAWSEYLDNTQVQRRVKDIEAAGLNPWLAVQNGISGTGAASVDTGGTAQHSHSSNQSKSTLSQLFIALAKIVE